MREFISRCIVKTSLCFVALAIGVTARGQGLRDVLGDEQSGGKMLGQESLDKQLQQLQVPKDAAGLFSDRAVDPTMYHVGPYDALLLTIWQPVNQLVMLTVSPENKLIVPRVGEFPCSGKTLQEVRTDVMAKLQERMNGRAEASLALYKPRNVLVQVQGEVKQPGSYVVPATARTSLAIQLANVASRDLAAPSPAEQEAQMEQRRREQQQKSQFGSVTSATQTLRHIVLHHNDGTTQRVDLLKYQTGGNERLNPMLREGDEIFVGLRKPERGEIGVYGAVQRPGLYEFADGDSLRDALGFAFGTSDNADVSRVSIRHEDASGAGKQESVDLASIMAGKAPDIPLHAGDGIVVGEITRHSEIGAVAVTGEVARPGMYAVTRGKTRLSEVMRNAGGFTAMANIANAYIQRRLLGPDGKDLDLRENALRAYMSSPLTLEDTLNFNMQARVARGAVVVDFKKLFVDGDSTSDVALQDGDEIVAPRNTNQVYVYGQVHHPGFVTYAPGKTVSYYVDKAGGESESAAGGKTGVIRGNTRMWTEAGRATVAAGDAIYVPKESDIPAGVRVQETSNILQGISTAAAVATVVVTYILLHK